MAVCVQAVAADRVVQIVNRTGVTLNEFYASNTDTDSWEEDILGKLVLRPGQSVEIEIDDGTGACHFDFKGVFDDGDEVIENSVNVCRGGAFSFND
ncbi:hypothetical protein FOZ76_11135 [Verticiella sediminum]|uniref:Uncharacterized protein n=2 Tax=Verticiella sediminum TaxID=1247510 RepID=A0A556ARQ6_9BURK|nr:hypothetical protein FOZ76_11135 [Verticiella sediminum]